MGVEGCGKLASPSWLKVVLDRLTVAMWCNSVVVAVAVAEFMGLAMSLLEILDDG